MSNEFKEQAILEESEKNQMREKKKAATTELYLHSRGHAAIALSKLHGSGFDDVTAFERLSRSVDRVLDGDLNEIEAMLITQAKSLEYVFYDALTKLPSASMEHAEVFGNIALKAQAGCRKTLMALAELKHPRRTTTIIKQQNNAITQQVNNNVKSEACEIENNKKIANELLSEVNHAALDFRRMSEAIRINQTMETVEVSGSEDT